MTQSSANLASSGPSHLNLQDPSKQIRLLELLPGKDSDLVRCTLKVATLQANLKYEALSYVWGNPKVKTDIEVDGRIIGVTRNLGAALRRMRYENTSRILWVDAVCIDQSNESEKSVQVGLMKNIYRDCQQCLVWLGELTDDDTPCTQQEAEYLFDYFRFWGQDHGQIKTSPFDINEHASPSVFQKFISLPWWTRVWTVQEIVLPKHGLLYWGQSTISWENIEKVVQNGINNTYPDAQGMKLLSHTLHNQLGIPVLPVWQARHLKCFGPIDFLRRFDHRAATDPRDKIFGLFGLDSFANFTFKADYTMNLEELSQRVTIELLIITKEMRFLVGKDDVCHSSGHQFPSWAADFFAKAPNFWSRYSRYDWYFCSKGRPSRFAWRKEDKSLALKGLNSDEICVVGKCCKVGSSLPKLRAAILEWKKLGDEELDHGFESEIGPRFLALLLGGIIADKDPNIPLRWATREDLELLQKFLRYEPADSGERMEEMERSLRVHLEHRRLFITKSGRMGIGPCSCEVGDQVWCLAGSSVPFVLRPAGDRKNCFTLVGDCYAQGMMFGEMLNDGAETTNVVLY